MGIVQRPMATGKWVHIGLYREYANLVNWNLGEQRYYEAIAVAVVSIDVLVHNIVENLLLLHQDKLNSLQVKALNKIKKDSPMVARVITILETHNILDSRLLRALRESNRIRNALVHPLTKGGELKKTAILPSKVNEKQAASMYRLLCHIIDTAGGQSPLSEERERNRYMRKRQREMERLR